jgi:predicted transposase/invertase (TIGR01784 family)
MDPEERTTYESSLKYYRDMNNVVETAKGEGWDEGLAEGLAEGEEKGKAKGKAEEKIEIAINCLKKEMDIKTISMITGLTIAEVESLNHGNKGNGTRH